MIRDYELYILVIHTVYFKQRDDRVGDGSDDRAKLLQERKASETLNVASKWPLTAQDYIRISTSWSRAVFFNTPRVQRPNHAGLAVARRPPPAARFLMSSHSRSSSYATSRLSLSTSQRPSSQKSEQRQLSTGSPLPGASPVHVSHKRRNDHGSPEDVKRRRQDTSSFATDELLKPSIVVRVGLSYHRNH